MRWAALRSAPVSQRWLRAVVGGGPVVALLAAGPAGEPAPVWLVAAVAAASLVFAVDPESVAGVVAMVAVLAWWGSASEVLLHPACLVAAGALLASHLSALVAGYAPAATAVDRAVLRRWLVRAAVVLPAAPVLWLLARALPEGEAPGALWPAGLAAAILVALLTSVLVGPADEPAAG